MKFECKYVFLTFQLTNIKDYSDTVRKGKGVSNLLFKDLFNPTKT